MEKTNSKRICESQLNGTEIEKKKVCLLFC